MDVKKLSVVVEQKGIAPTARNLESLAKASDKASPAVERLSSSLGGFKSVNIDSFAAKLQDMATAIKEVKTSTTGMADIAKNIGGLSINLTNIANATDRISGKTKALDDFTLSVKALKDQLIEMKGLSTSLSSIKIGGGTSGSSSSRASVDPEIKAQERLATQIERTAMMAGHTKAEYLELRAAQAGISDKVAPYIAKLKEQDVVTGKLGMTTKGYNAAMRMIPAQYTDIAVQLAGGQNPMLVLLQQGGQLKDMFGGVGNAAKAVAASLFSVTGVATMVAGAIGAVAYAAFSGSSEFDEYRKNIALTNNALAASTDSLIDLSAKLSASTGATKASTTELLTSMATGVKVATSVMSQAAEAAINLERAGGQAASATAQEFASLGVKPVEAVLKLDEKYKFLTASVYTQIEALSKQGKETEAATLAQQAFADALSGRLPQVEQNLGTIQRWWRAIKDEALGAVDAVKGLGREKSITELRELIDKGLPGAAGRASNSQIATWQKQLDILEQQAKTQDVIKFRQAEAEQDRSSALKRETSASALRLKYMSDEQKLSKEIKDINESALKDSEKAAAIKMATAQYTPKVTGTKNDLSQEYSARLAAEENYTETQIRLVKDRLAEQLITEEAAAGDILILQTGISNKRVSILREQLSKTKDIGDKAKIDEGITAALNRSEKAWADYTASLAKATKEYQKYQNGLVEASSKVADKLNEENDALRLQIDNLGISDEKQGQNEEAKLRNAAASEYLAAKTLREVYATQAASGASTEAISHYLDLADAREKAGKAIDKQAALRLEKGTKETLLETEKAWKKTSDKISDTITDALMRGFESGKSIAENLRDAIVNMFSTMVLRPVVQAVVTGSMTSLGMGTANAADASGVLSSASNTGGILSNLKSAYDMFSGGASSTYNTLATSSVGQSLGLSAMGSSAVPASTSMGLTIQGASTPYITQLGSSIGTGIASMGAGILGTAIGSAIAGDKRVIKGISGSTVGAGVGAAVGSIVPVIGTAIGAVVGGIIGGVVDRAFGMGEKKQGERGIKGSFGGSSFEGSTYSKWTQEGGWFRSDDSGTDTSPLDDSIEKSLSASFTLLKLEVGQLAEGLGVDTASIASYSKFVHLALTDDAEKNTAAINTMVAEISEELAGLALAGTNFGKAGEKNTETLNRLYSSLTAANQAFKVINVTAYKTSLAGGDMASQLVTLMGGLDAFKSSLTSYYETFFSVAEQQEDLANQVKTSLAAVGQTMPASKAAFREVVEGIDVTTEAGRTMFATMMGVASSFASVTDAIKQLVDSAITTRISLFDAIANDEQKLVVAQQKLESGFSALGIAVPKTKEAFYGLAVQADVTTTAGQSLIAALSALEPAFTIVAAAQQKWLDAVVAAAEAAQQAIIARNEKSASEHENLQTQWYQLMGDTVSLRKAELAVLEQENHALQQNIWAYQDAQEALATATSESDSALAAIQTAIDAQKTLNQTTLSTAENTHSTIKSLFSTLQDEIDNLYSNVSSTAANAAAKANLFIADALEKAKTKGVLPDSAELSKAISKAEAGIGEGASTFEADRARLILAGQLQQIQDIAGVQLTDSEKAVKVATDQLAATDSIYKNAQDQLNTLRGLNTSTLSVADAVEALQVALTKEKTQRQKLAEAAAGNSSVVSRSQAAADADPANIAASVRFATAEIASITAMIAKGGNLSWQQGQLDILNAYVASNPKSQTIPDAGTPAAETLVSAGAVVSAAAAVVSAVSNGTSLSSPSAALSAAANAPAFASGGWHSGGLRLVGEDGPELEATGASRIYNAEQTRNLMGGRDDTAIVEELRSVKLELIEARKQRDISNIRLAHIERAINGNPDQPILVEIAA